MGRTGEWTDNDCVHPSAPTRDRWPDWFGPDTQVRQRATADWGLLFLSRRWCCIQGTCFGSLAHKICFMNREWKFGCCYLCLNFELMAHTNALLILTGIVVWLIQRAVENGAEAVSEPEDKEWGQKVGYVRDIDGIVVRMGSYVQAPKKDWII